MGDQWPHAGAVAAIREQRSAWEDQLIDAGIAVYLSSDEPRRTPDEAMGTRSAVRSMMVRMRLYDRFVEELEKFE